MGAELPSVDSDWRHGDPPTYLLSADEVSDFKLRGFSHCFIEGLLCLLPPLPAEIFSPILDYFCIVPGAELRSSP